jgi:tetratricopeptide (TPR) repeat protein
MKNSVLAVCSLFLAVLLAMPSAVPAQDATPSEEAALDAYRQGENGRAVELYTKALSETDDPSHRARIQVQIAWNLFVLGRESEVLTRFRAALMEDPNLTPMSDYYPQDFMDLFEQARQSNFDAASGAPVPDLEATVASINDRIATESDLEGALADVDRLLAAYPRDGRLVPLKAQILRLVGRSEEADALSLQHGAGAEGLGYVDGFSVADLILRANRLLDAGDATTALQTVRQAVSRAPNNPFALELMAEAAMQTASWQDAEFALKSALGLQPDNIGLKLRLGEVYMATGEWSAARDVFKSLTDAYPNSDRAWASLGLLEARLRNHERALEALEKALVENPMLPEVQLARGELLLLKGDVDGAIDSLESAEKLLPNDPQIEARLGQSLLANGRNSEALRHLRAAVENGFEPPGVQRSLALAMALNGNYQESQRLLATLEPDDQGDRRIIEGYLELQQSRYEQAEAVLKELATRRPSNPESVNIFAAAIFPQYRFPETVALLEHAHELDPENPMIEKNLARAKAAQAAEELGANARAARPLIKN